MKSKKEKFQTPWATCLTEKKKETTLSKNTVATEKKNIVQKKKTVNTKNKTTNRTKKTDKQNPKWKTIKEIKTVVGDVQPSTSGLSKKVVQYLLTTTQEQNVCLMK